FPIGSTVAPRRARIKPAPAPAAAIRDGPHAASKHGTRSRDPQPNPTGSSRSSLYARSRAVGLRTRARAVRRWQPARGTLERSNQVPGAHDRRLGGRSAGADVEIDA